MGERVMGKGVMGKGVKAMLLKRFTIYPFPLNAASSIWHAPSLCITSQVGEQTLQKSG
jgi:hypothetical protein